MLCSLLSRYQHFRSKGLLSFGFVYLFTCGLFNDTVNSTDYIVLHGSTIMDQKEYKRKQSWSVFKAVS
jgi:hypothetical protein